MMSIIIRAGVARRGRGQAHARAAGIHSQMNRDGVRAAGRICTAGTFAELRVSVVGWEKKKKKNEGEGIGEGPLPERC